jgi:tRNA (guanine37-N1)-methyltransferase
VLGNEASIAEESFSDASDGLLEYPQYTRPKTFHGLDVPEILTSGDHAKIAAWRTERAVERTTERRPDLISRARSKSR